MQATPPPFPLGTQDVDPPVEHAASERDVVLLALEAR